MRIKTSTPILDLSGNQIEKMTVGKVLSDILGSDQSGMNQMKFYTLAQKFYNDEEVVIDSADKQIIIGAVEKTKIYFPIITGQLLILLSETKND